MAKTPPKHHPSIIDSFAIKKHNLTVGNQSLSQLAERVGQTPFYAYDRSKMTHRLRQLRSQMPDDLKIHYAMKANPMPAVVQHMAGIVDGLDVASAGEMKVALDTGMSAQQISMAGPGKRPVELAQAVAAGITINVESFNELEELARQSNRLGIAATVAVRINPAFELKSSGMKMGGGPKQFGVDEEQVPILLKRIAELELDFAGFHIFSGSQSLKPEAIIEAQHKSIELAIQLADSCPGPIRKLNIGGGLGIPYFPGESPLEIEPIGHALAKQMQRAKQYLPEASVIVELGRYLVGEAGVYVTRIVDRKVSHEQFFLITDGGLNHHLSASGNFGQTIRKNYPVAIGNKMNWPQKEIASVGGPLCTPLDLLADKMELSKAEVGDLFVIFQSGAYGYSASPAMFLNQTKVIEVLV
ncbi:MAG: pyridoxal-dependent decarboxylase, exosortase A system-associated [Pseudomonadales bacterium]|nr:pyridoxal-dependent decarboxylase, exosortase A system-associated [Pseudomonadales bacterium]